MTDQPKKTLSLKKPASTSAPAEAVPVVRTGKRIIRRDELPQVQPVRPSKPKPAKAKPKQKFPKKPSRKKPIIKPSDLKAKELNDRLNGFNVWLNYQPLALGTEKELFRLVNAEHFPGASKKVVQKVLHMHTRHGRYLQSIMEGGDRFQLDGTRDGEVTPDQQLFAAELVRKRGS